MAEPGLFGALSAKRTPFLLRLLEELGEGGVEGRGTVLGGFLHGKAELQHRQMDVFSCFFEYV